MPAAPTANMSDDGSGADFGTTGTATSRAWSVHLTGGHHWKVGSAVDNGSGSGWRATGGGVAGGASTKLPATTLALQTVSIQVRVTTRWNLGRAKWWDARPTCLANLMAWTAGAAA